MLPQRTRCIIQILSHRAPTASHRPIALVNCPVVLVGVLLIAPHARTSPRAVPAATQAPRAPRMGTGCQLAHRLSHIRACIPARHHPAIQHHLRVQLSKRWRVVSPRCLDTSPMRCAVWHLCEYHPTEARLPETALLRRDMQCSPPRPAAKVHTHTTLLHLLIAQLPTRAYDMVHTCSPC